VGKLYLQNHPGAEVTGYREMRPQRQSELLLIHTFLAMKADESADCAVLCCNAPKARLGVELLAQTNHESKAAGSAQEQKVLSGEALGKM
jgi:hypothetical protein